MVGDVTVGLGWGSMEMSDMVGVRLRLDAGELVVLAEKCEVCVVGDALVAEAAEKLDIDAGAVLPGEDAETGREPSGGRSEKLGPLGEGSGSLVSELVESGKKGSLMCSDALVVMVVENCVNEYASDESVEV